MAERRGLRTVAACITSAAWFVGAANAAYAGLFGSPEPPVESEVQLPPFPNDADLLPFYVRATDPNEYFVDASSLAVGSDGIVRIALLVRSPQGAVSVRFEGFWCEASQRKVYAIGGVNRTWTKPRTVEWTLIGSGASGLHERVLARDYLCPNGIPIRTAREGIQALRRGGHESLGPTPGF
jgi:hypothetical protein